MVDRLRGRSWFNWIHTMASRIVSIFQLDAVLWLQCSAWWTTREWWVSFLAISRLWVFKCYRDKADHVGSRRDSTTDVEHQIHWPIKVKPLSNFVRHRCANAHSFSFSCLQTFRWRNQKVFAAHSKTDDVCAKRIVFIKKTKLFRKKLQSEKLSTHKLLFCVSLSNQRARFFCRANV